ncbi:MULTISPECIES: hypothetical protein [Vibrio]|uniref:MazG-related protein n=1 Tax=Vibrio jasicida TaxID=766224 RepID=A0AAU9QHE6_9VIBR|nr:MULTISPECIES: hypothetical protein [Vibrio]KIP66256.1 MazG-related protein [Vibrio harveyi]KIP71945.1 MazG-related protein [Vibrio harveyi]CAH1563333.1 MazG-related protein [Vibrio jasicida]CAH1572562.1 MazG-related protein [Vibrio jasicida]
MNQSVLKAMTWLKGILDSNQITYQIVGGFAAHLHGGSRPIADIDLYIQKQDSEKLLPHIAPYISKPLKHYQEEGWDLEYLQLIYGQQKIEIGLSPGTRIFSSKNKEWATLEIDYAANVICDFNGMKLSVIDITRLIDYKRVLSREVDLIDIRELERIQQQAQ